ncbi:MAG: SGNH/GDSL hydrolase family protein [Clostridia bacterium]|nr:SGNH/GDSL hydrolase family protein [Clostridia bacterium]
MKKTYRLTIGLTAVLCGVSLLATACGQGGTTSSDPASTPETTTTTATSTTTTTTGGDTTGTQETSATTGTTSSATGTKTETATGISATTKTSTTKKPTTTKPTKQEDALMDYTKYNIDCYIEPIWKGNVVYNESVMFVPDPVTGEMTSAPLMYKPDKILSVRSSDLTKVYKEGADFVVTEDGRIQLTEKTRMPFWAYDDYFMKTYESFGLPSKLAKGRYYKYAAGDTFLKTQICVTYTHSDKWNGPVPKYAGNVLKNTVSKLKNKQPLRIVYNGDSITVGAESSKWNNVAPYVPIWSEMVTQELRKVYDAPLLETNTAVGGMDSAWGLANVEENINKYTPTLVVLGFGMNDGTQGVRPAHFKKNIQDTIDKVRAKHPDCEFILVSTTMPNPDVSGPWTQFQADYQEELEDIAEDYEGVAVAKMTDMHLHLLTLKRYWDMTGNNINHPNDFLARVYAQVIAQMLVEEL